MSDRFFLVLMFLSYPTGIVWATHGKAMDIEPHTYAMLAALFAVYGRVLPPSQRYELYLYNPFTTSMAARVLSRLRHAVALQWGLLSLLSLMGALGMDALLSLRVLLPPALVCTWWAHNVHRRTAAPWSPDTEQK